MQTRAATNAQPATRARTPQPVVSPAGGRSRTAPLFHAAGSERHAVEHASPRPQHAAFDFSTLALLPGHPTTSPRPPVLQRKAVVTPANDRYEREADVVADRVLGMAEPSAIAATPVAIQRKCKACEEDETTIQAKTGPAADAGAALDVDAAVRAASRAGEPLPRTVRDFFEPRFGRDFGDVRVHADGTAAGAARAVQARAYTIGRDIVFGAGQFAPGTSEGKRLIAHELTHTVQQTGGSAHPQHAISRAPDAIQRAGDPAAIPAGLPCPTDLSTGAPAGTSVMFGESDSAISPAHTALLTTLRSTWLAAGGTGDILVHGYASTDGPQGLNWTLSCSRATAVQAELVRLGIPAARISVVAHGESTDFGAGLSVNRRAVVVLKPPAAPPPAPPTPPAPPAETITSETVETTPTPRSRTNIGVGETVTLRHAPGSAAWTINPAGPTGGSLSAASGASVIWTAPDTAQTVTVTGGAAPPIVFTVIPPNDVHMDRVGTTLKHSANQPDSGMETIGFLLPDTVNFHNVTFHEMQVAGVATNPGVYSCNPFSTGHCAGAALGAACANLAMTATVVAGKGTQAVLVDGVGSDCVYSGHCGTAPPFLPGSVTIAIPYEYRVGTGAFRQFRVVNQVHTLLAGGSSLTSSKAGATVPTTVAAAASTIPGCP